MDPYGKPTTGFLIPSASDLPGRFFAFWVHGDATTAWLSVSLGKHYVRHYPPDMMWIRERFPPLRVRLTKLTNGQVVEQERSASCFGEREIRCQILASEALRRDPTNDEFRSLISGPIAPEALLAAHTAGILPRYRNVLVARLDDLAASPRPPPSEEKVSGPTAQEAFLSAMDDATEVDLTPEVFDLFRSDQFGSFGATYLADRIQTLADAYDFVQLLTQRRERIQPWRGIPLITKRIPAASQSAISAPLSSKLHIELSDIPFARGEADFPASESWRQTQFRNLKQALAASTEPLTIVVEGHAAPDEGDADSGLSLSARRADAVKVALEHAGIPADRIRTVNLGSSRPYCTDSDPQRDCAGWNGRVHFTY